MAQLKAESHEQDLQRILSPINQNIVIDEGVIVAHHHAMCYVVSCNITYLNGMPRMRDTQTIPF